MPAKGDFDESASKRSKYQRKYNSQPEQKKRRAARNATRRKLMKQGRVRKGDGKDIDHKDGNPMNQSGKNLRVQSKKVNRTNGGRKGGKR